MATGYLTMFCRVCWWMNKTNPKSCMKSSQNQIILEYPVPVFPFTLYSEYSVLESLHSRLWRKDWADRALRHATTVACTIVPLRLSTNIPCLYFELTNRLLQKYHLLRWQNVNSNADLVVSDPAVMLNIHDMLSYDLMLI
jgi:hypothetical protein